MAKPLPPAPPTPPALPADVRDAAAMADADFTAALDAAKDRADWTRAHELLCARSGQDPATTASKFRVFARHPGLAG